MKLDSATLATIPSRLLPALLYLAEKTDQTGSIPEIARQLHQSPRSVMRHLHDLETAKYIVREKTAGRANTYKVRL